MTENRGGNPGYAGEIVPGFKAVPMQPETGVYYWPVCVVVAVDPAEPVMLANLPGSRAYLGCVLDGGGRVREWVQIWVQNLADLSDLTGDFPGELSGAQMDARWRRQWEAVRQLMPASVVQEVGEEQSRPLYLDLRDGRGVGPRSPAGTEWLPCRDDAVLERAGLPKYSQSVFRYLSAAMPDGGSPMLVAADPEAPLADQVERPAAGLGFDPDWVALNPQGGRLAIRTHASLDLEDYIDLLNGLDVAEVGARKHRCEEAALLPLLAPHGDDRGRHGLRLTGGNGLEIFLLKLRAFAQAARSLHTHLQRQQCPLLNLDPASFGVWVGAAGDLPWTWTSVCDLSRPGRALKLRIPENEEVRFLAAGNPGRTDYCPTGLTRRTDLTGTIQPLEVRDEGAGRWSFTGKIKLVANVDVVSSDLVRFRLAQAGWEGDFYASIVTGGSGSRREIDFRTWPRAMEPRQAALLKKGGRFERCWCEIIPVLSSPYDLYSLAALGARTLLAHDANPLPVVLEELESLGREAGEELPEGATFQQVVPVVERLLAAGTREALYARHCLGKLQSELGGEAVPSAGSWAEAVALLLRLTPGLGPVSECADYGAAPAGNLHGPLTEPLGVLESLCARTRSLLFSNWLMNQEIQQVLATVQQEWED